MLSGDTHEQKHSLQHNRLPILVGLARLVRAVMPEIVTLLTHSSNGGVVTNQRPWSETANVFHPCHPGGRGGRVCSDSSFPSPRKALADRR